MPDGVATSIDTEMVVVTTAVSPTRLHSKLSAESTPTTGYGNSALPAGGPYVPVTNPTSAVIVPVPVATPIGMAQESAYVNDPAAALDPPASHWTAHGEAPSTPLRVPTDVPPNEPTHPGGAHGKLGSVAVSEN